MLFMHKMPQNTSSMMSIVLNLSIKIHVGIIWFKMWKLSGGYNCPDSIMKKKLDL